jgi:hypothetical protein
MVAAGVVGAVLARFRGLAADQLVEVAFLATGGLLLIQQGEVRFVELRRTGFSRFAFGRTATLGASI